MSYFSLYRVVLIGSLPFHSSKFWLIPLHRTVAILTFRTSSNVINFSLLAITESAFSCLSGKLMKRFVQRIILSCYILSIVVTNLRSFFLKSFLGYVNFNHFILVLNTFSTQNDRTYDSVPFNIVFCNFSCSVYLIFGYHAT